MNQYNNAKSMRSEEFLFFNFYLVLSLLNCDIMKNFEENLRKSMII